MSVMTLVSWALCGLVVGLIARFLIPGRQNMSLLMTMALGIVGALVGGFLYWSIWGASGASFSLSGDAWQGWIVSIIGAGIVLWGYAVLHPRLWWQ